MTVHENAKPLLRAQLASATGCNPETVRYYEKIGLLPPPDRSATGYRLYTSAHVQRLRFTMRARELGFSIGDIKDLLGLADGGRRSCASVKSHTERHLADIRTRICDLKRIEKVLARTARLCSGDDVPECPVLDALAGPETGLPPAAG